MAVSLFQRFHDMNILTSHSKLCRHWLIAVLLTAISLQAQDVVLTELPDFFVVI